MNEIKLSLKNKDNEIEKTSHAVDKTFLAIRHGYALGDYFEVEVPEAPTYLMVSMDESLGESLIYLTKTKWKYQIPFDLQREWPYPSGAFKNHLHYVTARFATNSEVSQYRNVAVNMHDQHDENYGAYPHAVASAETRGEYVFYGRNAIDGILANEKHGNYPFQSWGINQDDHAELKILFGRSVTVDQLGLVLRADYPHDSYWTELTIEFSDGSQEVLHPIKTASEQFFSFTPRTIDWFKLTNLIKDKDMSTFPALTQIELYGK